MFDDERENGKNPRINRDECFVSITIGGKTVKLIFIYRGRHY